MKPSNFKFKTPRLDRIQLEVYEISEKIERVRTDVSFQVQQEFSKTKDNEAVVSLKIGINDIEELDLKNNDIPFILDMQISSVFTWEETLSQDMVEILLSQNAPALLLSYARPIIQMNTSSTIYPGFELPFFDFTS